jgi:hypothetical protein
MTELSDAKPPRRWLRLLPVCGCALLAVAAVGLAVLIKLPSADADWRDFCEETAVGRLRTYAAAQARFRNKDRDGDGQLAYAASCAELGAEKDQAGRPLRLVAGSFVAAHGPGGEPDTGYLFLEMKTVAGRAIDWGSDFALCAFPAGKNVATCSTFIVKTDGVVWRRQRPEGGSVEDFPADPAKEGWTVVE